jgi:hypothetical protein
VAPAGKEKLRTFPVSDAWVKAPLPILVATAEGVAPLKVTMTVEPCGALEELPPQPVMRTARPHKNNIFTEPEMLEVPGDFHQFIFVSFRKTQTAACHYRTNPKRLFCEKAASSLPRLTSFAAFTL